MHQKWHIRSTMCHSIQIYAFKTSFEKKTKKRYFFAVLDFFAVKIADRASDSLIDENLVKK